jgi:hypothetical protein
MAISIKFQGVTLRKPGYWGMPPVVRPQLLIEGISPINNDEEVAINKFWLAAYRFELSNYIPCSWQRDTSDTMKLTLVQYRL